MGGGEMTLRELLECLKTDDYGEMFDLDAEVGFFTEWYTPSKLELLSVYYDDDGGITVDIG
jgi:hypothetical protein